jgi:hypothetical protein
MNGANLDSGSIYPAVLKGGWNGAFIRYIKLSLSSVYDDAALPLANFNLNTE